MTNPKSFLCLVPLLALCPLYGQTPVKPATPPQPADVSSVQTPPAPAAKTYVDTTHYELGPDDQVRVWVLGADEITDKPVRVSPEGDLELPVVGKVHVAGMTVDQTKAKLTELFSKELLHPQVSVDIVEFGSQPVSVVGAFNHPGVFQLHGQRTLAEVISMAEGLRPDAGYRITISRELDNGNVPLPGARLDPTGKYSVAEIKVKDWLAGNIPADNIRILPHDVVTASGAQNVYVMGNVKKPGEVALKDSESISVLQALASAEGLAPQSAPQRAMIVRLSPNSTARQEIPVDLRKIQKGTGEDMEMRPNDILIVPSSASEKAAVRMAEAAIQTLTGVIVWHSY